MSGSMRSVPGLVILILCLILLTGCEPQTRPAAPAAAPAATMPAARPTSTPIKVTTQVPAAIDAVPTVTASATPSPSPEPAPAASVEASGAEACSNAAQFEADVTIPDNTILPPEQTFVKTWRLRNTGTCAWSTSYELMRDSGAELGGPASVGLPLAVARNATVDISVQLAAPATQGAYAESWQLADADGRRFGRTITVVIVVPDLEFGETLPDEIVYMYGGGGGGGGTCRGAF